MQTLFASNIGFYSGSNCNRVEQDKCFLEVEGVNDHTTCDVIVDTGEPISSVFIDLASGWVELSNISSLDIGQKFYISVSCPP